VTAIGARPSGRNHKRQNEELHEFVHVSFSFPVQVARTKRVLDSRDNIYLEDNIHFEY
jgi:hypothetical protein